MSLKSAKSHFTQILSSSFIFLHLSSTWDGICSFLTVKIDEKTLEMIAKRVILKRANHVMLGGIKITVITYFIIKAEHIYAIMNFYVAQISWSIFKS